MKTSTETRDSSGRAAKNCAGLTGSQSGQSLVELALLTPLLMIMLIGIAEMGRYAYFAMLVGNAARAGAAWGAQSPGASSDQGDIATVANNDFQNGANLAGLTVTSTNLCTCDNGGSFTSAPTNPLCFAATNPSAGTCTTGHWVILVQVTAAGTFSPMFKYSGGLFGILKIPSLTFSSTATQRVAL